MKLDTNVKKQYKGLNKSFNPLEQPEGTYTFGLNMVNDSSEGNINNLVSEPSNELCVEFPEDYYIVGSIYGENKTSYVFVTNNDGDDYIYQIYNCNSTLLVNTDFGFNTINPIEGEYRIRRGCDPQIYWQDYINPDRQFNINRPDDYKTNDDWDINKFELKPDILPPCINLLNVNNFGGNLELGTYAAQLEILDESLNLMYRTYITPNIPIYDNNITEEFNFIDGGFNIEQITELNGGVNVTNKSITFEFTDLPIEFSYARLNIIRSISGDETTRTAVQDSTLIPINNSTLQYTYTGYNPSRGDILLDYSSLLVSNTKYNSSKTITQVQNRLVRANVQQIDKDYTGFQRLTNDITTEYITRNYTLNDQTQLGNAKNPNTYWEQSGYLGDEVYAFGIVYVYSDGTESPTFHIPGRPSIGFDKDNIRTEVELHEVEHLGVTESNLNDDTYELERWKVYNTSQGNGQMGYYEISNNYPTTKDCLGEYVYGDLADTPIRHHKFPCRTVEELFDFVSPNNTFQANQLGIKFDNIQYPNDVVAHYIVRVKRDEYNKTVIDNGVIGLLTGSSEEDLVYTPQHDGYNQNIKHVFYISPEGQFNKNINGSHIVINGQYNLTDAELDEYGTIQSHEYVTTEKLNYGVSKHSILPTGFNSNLQNNFNLNSLNNFSVTNDIPILELNSDISIPEQSYFYVTLKKNNEVYTNLDSLRYVRIHSCSKLTTDTEYFGGDSFIAPLNFTDIQSFGDITGTLLINGYYRKDIVVESPLNFSLRSQTNDNSTNYYNGATSFSEYCFNKVWDDANNVLTGFDEGYLYNKDFNQINGDTLYFTLPITYDYCNKCTNINPFRIVFSPKSFDIEIGDTYRINLTDDYIDLPGHRGEITSIEYKNNKLIVHTSQTTFVLQPNPQFVATDQNNAYLNTGDFLSIPPSELVETDTGYGGLKNKLARVNCKYDYIWLDEVSQDLIGLNSGSINADLSQWFQENIGFKINEQFNDNLNIDFPQLNSITDKNGVGYQIIYDDRFDRIIINKRDYEVSTFKQFQGVVTDNADMTETGVYYNSTTNIWYYNGSNFTLVIDPDSRYFCNRSWTLSYDFKTKSFISFHSYHPKYMYFDEANFYSTDNNKIYKHLHKSSYLEFYDTLYPFVLEWVENKYITNNLYSVQYMTKFLEYNNNSLIERNDVNYTHLNCYNSAQNTGKLNLNLLDRHTNPYGNISLQLNSKNIITTDYNHKIAGLYDMSISVDNYSNDCDIIAANIEIDGYVENVPININFSKDQVNCGQLRDKWHKIKLFYYPTQNNIKLIHQLSNTVTQNSVR